MNSSITSTTHLLNSQSQFKQPKMKNSRVCVIVAVEKNLGIGKETLIPWHFKKEFRYFKKITTTVKDSNKQNAVLMGRTTWYSLPEKSRPLPNRKNMVLTFEYDHEIDMPQRHTVEEGIEALKKDEGVETIFIIGGASIYKYAVENLELDALYITKVDKDYNCDTFFPEIPERYNKITKLGQDQEDGVKFEFLLYEPK